MWVEETKNGKYRLYERYVDPLTGKKRKASVLMEKNTAQAINKARPLLIDRIAQKTDIKALQTEDIRLSELADEYLEFKSHTLAKNSMISYKYLIRLFVQDFNPETLLEKITRKSIQNYFFELSEKKRLSSIRQYYTIIKNMFGFAVENEYISESPFNNIKLVSNIEPKNIEDNYLTQTEREEILTLAYQQNERYALLIEWLLNSGMRIAEALGLQYKKIQDNTVIINEQLQHKELVKPKTKTSIRQIDMTQRMMEILERTKALNYPHTSANDFIFQNNANSFMIQQNVLVFLDSLSQKTSFDKKLHSHMFRHTHISILAENNVNIKAIMKRVGHSSPDITMKIYTHITEKMEQDMQDKLNDIF